MWIIIIAIAVIVGGPVLILLGMFVAWRLPGIILGDLALLILMAVGRATEKDAGPGEYGRRIGGAGRLSRPAGTSRWNGTGGSGRAK